jgi:SAM-dependent methyltransferase
MPEHDLEIDRLDLQHYAYLLALGTNHLAPIEAPSRILDVGTGSGQWAFDMCREFPQAFAIGLDLRPSKPKAPSNYAFVRASMLDGLPFEDGSFDFTHERLVLVTGIPPQRWEAALSELVRVTKPGGWVEVMEAGRDFVAAGPATLHLYELAGRLASAHGLDPDGSIARRLATELRARGLQQVEQTEVALPIGEWAGRLGSLILSDVRAGFTRMGLAMPKIGVDEEEFTGLLGKALRECEERQTQHVAYLAFGRRPA